MRHSIQGYEVFKAIGTSTSICDSGVEYFRTNWLRLPKGRHGSMRSSSRTFYRTDVCSRKDRCVRMLWGILWTPDPVKFPGTFAPVTTDRLARIAQDKPYGVAPMEERSAQELSSDFLGEDRRERPPQSQTLAGPCPPRAQKPKLFRRRRNVKK